jgi:hypothetical protein
MGKVDGAGAGSRRLEEGLETAGSPPGSEAGQWGLGTEQHSR